MTQEGRSVDISEFEALTAQRVQDPSRYAEVEEQRAALLAGRFRSTTSLRWEVAFANDPELLGRILRDILKLDRATPGRHGPRPGLDRVRDMPALDRLRGLDPTRHPYSLLPFREAFGLLIGERSLRSVVNKTGIGLSRVYRLKEGLGTPPTMAEMEQIAERFGHHPSFFAEYRAWAIQEAVREAMASQLERARSDKGERDVSVVLYERLWMRTSAAEARGDSEA